MSSKINVRIDAHKLEKILAKDMNEVNAVGFSASMFAIGHYLGMEIQIHIQRAPDEYLDLQEENACLQFSWGPPPAIKTPANIAEELRRTEDLTAPHPNYPGKESSLHREGLLLDAAKEIESLHKRVTAFRATALARSTIMPGDKISRTMCAGLKGTFTFTHWEGEWMCGKTVHDCHATHVYKINGVPVSFYEQAAKAGA